MEGQTFPFLYFILDIILASSTNRTTDRTDPGLVLCEGRGRISPLSDTVMRLHRVPVFCKANRPHIFVNMSALRSVQVGTTVVPLPAFSGYGSIFGVECGYKWEIPNFEMPGCISSIVAPISSRSSQHFWKQIWRCFLALSVWVHSRERIRLITEVLKFPSCLLGGLVDLNPCHDSEDCAYCGVGTSHDSGVTNHVLQNQLRERVSSSALRAKKSRIVDLSYGCIWEYT